MSATRCLNCAEDEGNEVLMVAGLVKVIHAAAGAKSKQGGGAEGPYGRVVLEWDSGPLSDCVADSVISILLQEQGQPAAIGAAEQQRECVHYQLGVNCNTETSEHIILALLHTLVSRFCCFFVLRTLITGPIYAEVSR